MTITRAIAVFMSILHLFIGRILRFFHFLAGLLKRALCFMRKRETIGELPYSVVTHSNFEPSTPTANNPTNWNGDFQWNEKTIVEDKIDQWRKNKEVSKDSEEPDFFNDMIPDIKRPKKAILKQKTSPTVGHTPQNLFAFQGDDIPVPTGGELGDLDETAGWDDDISSTLREQRQQKIKARHEEYERRMATRKGLYGQS